MKKLMTLLAIAGMAHPQSMHAKESVNLYINCGDYLVSWWTDGQSASGSITIDRYKQRMVAGDARKQGDVLTVDLLASGDLKRYSGLIDFRSKSSNWTILNRESAKDEWRIEERVGPVKCTITKNE